MRRGRAVAMLTLEHPMKTGGLVRLKRCRSDCRSRGFFAYPQFGGAFHLDQVGRKATVLESAAFLKRAMQPLIPFMRQQKRRHPVVNWLYRLVTVGHHP